MTTKTETPTTLDGKKRNFDEKRKKARRTWEKKRRPTTAKKCIEQGKVDGNLKCNDDESLSDGRTDGRTDGININRVTTDGRSSVNGTMSKEGNQL